MWEITTGEPTMNDSFYFFLTFLFFAASFILIEGLDRLREK